jgi:hypothetical protein
MFEHSLAERELPAGTPNADQIRVESRAFTITDTAKNIEMLAGAGELANARSLAERLLRYDASDATKALVQKHIERAGQPTLLTSPATR